MRKALLGVLVLLFVLGFATQAFAYGYIVNTPTGVFVRPGQTSPAIVSVTTANSTTTGSSINSVQDFRGRISVTNGIAPADVAVEVSTDGGVTWNIVTMTAVTPATTPPSIRGTFEPTSTPAITPGASSTYQFRFTPVVATAGKMFPVTIAWDNGLSGAAAKSASGSAYFQVRDSATLPNTGVVPKGVSFSYKDLQDAIAKNEGGYNAFNGTVTFNFKTTQNAIVNSGAANPAAGSVAGAYTNQGYTTSPHGGYDTTTNKCKVCHAVHRADGAYYLLRADSQDDACVYCHIGGSAHSNLVVYDLNPDGIYTTNGHTIGAQTQIPDSSVFQYAQPVTLSTTDANGNPLSETIEVRAYEQEKNEMYRFTRHHGQGDEGSGRSGYNRIGPLALRCMNCHQVHNAVDETWRPLAWNWVFDTSDTNIQNLTTFESTGFKLLKRYPAASVIGTMNPEGYWNPGQQVKVIEANAVKKGSTGPWGVESANFSGEESAEFQYTENGELAAAPLWIAQDIHEPDVASYPTPGSGYYRYPYFNSKYALSYWCADCHNLNIGGWEPLADPELGFKAHTERTHPAPYYGSYSGPGQCYSCHRNDLSPIMGPVGGNDTNGNLNPNQTGYGSGLNSGAGASRNSCTQCHYGTSDYARESQSTAFDFDFPHSGKTTDMKLLGSYTVPVPSGGFTDGSFGAPSTVPSLSTRLVGATITPSNLDAVCLRCHPGVGVHM